MTNNFRDGRYQDALDLFLGVYVPSPSVIVAAQRPPPIGRFLLLVAAFVAALLFVACRVLPLPALPWALLAPLFFVLYASAVAGLLMTPMGQRFVDRPRFRRLVNANATAPPQQQRDRRPSLSSPPPAAFPDTAPLSPSRSD